MTVPRVDQTDPKGELVQLLLDDVLHSSEELTRSESAAGRRSYIRCVVTFIEGLCAYMRWLLLQRVAGVSLRTGTVPLTTLALLLEQSPTCDDNGDEKLDYQRVPVLAHAKFTIKRFAREVSVDSAPLLGDNGWNNVRATINLRNRLVHPKEVAHLHVSDKDMRAATSAFNWFDGVIGTLFDAGGNAGWISEGPDDPE